jgi:hypothetical protein
MIFKQIFCGHDLQHFPTLSNLTMPQSMKPIDQANLETLGMLDLAQTIPIVHLR